jgi:hypothetical protein
MRYLPVHRVFILFCVFPVFLLSCAAGINGSLAADGSAVFSVNMSLEPRITALIRSLTAAAGGQSGGAALDGLAIANSLSKAPGISSAVLRNTAFAAIEGEIRISGINDFLNTADIEPGAKRDFIHFEHGRTGGRFAVNLTRENGPVVLALLSSEIEDYLNVLMAPVATGEEMSKNEYLQLVSMFYNRAISDEIAASRVRVSIDFPGTITNVRGGTFSGRRAVFEIPVLDILVLESPLIYEVSWN